ncbi:MAG: hypothetical protein WCC06_08935 [Candidatus Aminicenantales bacterium]
MDSTKRTALIGFPTGVIVLLIIVFLGSCNWGIPDFTLSVIIEDGVTGTPEAGQYIYKDLSTIEYSYTPIDPLQTAEVLLNDKIRKPAAGSIVLYADKYVLKARLVDIRGVWDVEMTWSDLKTEKFTLTIVGADLLSGTFIDSRGYNGSWAVASGTVTFTYSDWSDYILTGGVYEMEGSFTGDDDTGIWSAERQS